MGRPFHFTVISTGGNGLFPFYSFIFKALHMNKLTFAPVLVLAAGLSLSACAQTRKTPKATSYARVLDGSVTRILGGREETGIQYRYVLHLVWKSTTPPVSFFWRPSDGWQTCVLYKGYSSNERAANPVAPESVRKGDTLTIIPLSGGRDAMPAGISSSLKNALFFKTSKSKWMYLPVKLKKAADLVTP